MNALQAHHYKMSIIDDEMGVVATRVADGVDKGAVCSTGKTKFLVENGEYTVVAVDDIEDLAVVREVNEVPDDALALVLFLLVLEHKLVDQPVDGAASGLVCDPKASDVWWGGHKLRVSGRETAIFRKIPTHSLPQNVVGPRQGHRCCRHRGERTAVMIQ